MEGKNATLAKGRRKPEARVQFSMCVYHLQIDSLYTCKLRPLFPRTWSRFTNHVTHRFATYILIYELFVSDLVIITYDEKVNIVPNPEFVSI